MSKPQPINLIEHRSAPKVEVPEPMFGYCIVRPVKVEMHGATLYLPTAGATGMESQPVEQQKDLCRYRVVKTHKQFLRGIQVLDTPFGPGDYVQIAAMPGVEAHGERYPLMLPKDYITVAIHHICAHLSGEYMPPEKLDS